MSEVEFIKNLLEANWEETITGRSTDVPEPTFVLEKDQSEARLRNHDTGYVTSGGDTNANALGFSWTHQQVDTAVVIQYRGRTRSTDVGYDNGYNRLFGKRTGADGLGEPDRWDGIAGETQRVILAERHGRAEWSRIGTDHTGSPIRVVDNTDLGGTNYYRADVYVPMDIIAQEIDASV